MRQHTIFVIPDSSPSEILTKTFEQNFQTAYSPLLSAKRRYWDTFDWRLYQNNLTLFWQQGKLHLQNIKGDKKRGTIPWPAKKNLGTINTLPDGMVREILAPIIDIRALLLLADPSLAQQHFRILNRDKKSTVRLSISSYGQKTQAQQLSTPFLTTLGIEPIRGYDKDARRCEKLALSLGLIPTDNDTIIKSIYSAFDRTPLSYSTKLALHFPPEGPAAMAAITLFKGQLAVMQENEAGIEADIDTEFLHDFRVALRRTRAGLSEIKDVFSEELTCRFKNDFKQIGSKTNRLRDLDVYLLKKEYYKSLLPEQLQGALSHLFRLLEQERRREIKKVQQLLKSPQYRKTITDWGLCLDSFQLTGKTAGRRAQSHTRTLAREFIYKRWKRVLKRGRSLSKTSPDEELHNLRLECKKLRYLLEFFASVFSTKVMKFLIKQLKHLQENLGDFNDLCVQQETLQEYLAKQVCSTRDNSLNIAAAIGGLIANLNQKQQDVRALFEGALAQFDRPETHTLFQETFKKTSSGDHIQ